MGSSGASPGGRDPASDTTARPEHRALSAGWVPGEDQGEGVCGRFVGTTGGSTESRLSRRVRDSLWVELSPGGGLRGGSHAGLAALCGAADEPELPRGGVRGGNSIERVGGRVSQRRRAGGANSRTDEPGEGGKGSKAGARDERGGCCGIDGGWLVQFSPGRVDPDHHEGARRAGSIRPG